MAHLLFNPDGTVNLPESVRKDIEKEYRQNFKSQKKKMPDIWEDEEIDDKEHNLNDDVSGFNLYLNEKKLSPLKFSNNKTQEDVVNEVIDEIKNGKKIIFIHGVCGTGKSIIALNIGKKLGRASIVVPGKALQKQYHEDYSNKKYVLKDNHKKLKIKVITGRNNHKCLYCSGKSADDSQLPCKIEIKESNIIKLREYLKENPKVKDNLELKNIRRMSVAPVCPYWSPVVPSEMDMNLSGEKKKYLGLNNTEFTIHQRKPGCRYYEQFNSFVNGEAIIFNSMKYKLETAMNRKPATDVEIIDECDEFLDSFSNIKTINLNRLLITLNKIFPEDESLVYVLEKMSKCVIDIMEDYSRNNLRGGEILPVNRTGIHALLKYFSDNSKMNHILEDEESYYHYVYEVAKIFEDFLDESYVSFSKEERGVIASIVTTNLAKKFKEMLDKNKAIVLMSGTIHSEHVLRNIFGLDDFVFIDAETINQGEIEAKETGYEKDCKYENFKNGSVSREDYLLALDRAVKESVKPTLVHVNSFEDLPNEAEKERYLLDNLITKNKLKNMQYEDNGNNIIEKFKNRGLNVLFTTKCSRGVDFPKDECNSIVFTKFPYPNASSVFWKVLKKNTPEYYWAFYNDKAKREFLQKIYRGVRSSDDHVYVLSPDIRVLRAVESFNLSN